MRIWLAILALSALSWLLKASAPLIIGARKLPPAAVRVTSLVAPVLLAGLLVTDLGTGARNWPQLGGIAFAGVLTLARVPLLPALAGGVLVTALTRFLAS